LKTSIMIPLISFPTNVQADGDGHLIFANLGDAVGQSATAPGALHVGGLIIAAMVGILFRALIDGQARVVAIALRVDRCDCEGQGEEDRAEQ
jgi:hypothetical protein